MSDKNNTDHFLLELGCAELPAIGLASVANQMAERLIKHIENARLSYENFKVFVSPRRLSILVRHLERSQADRTVEKRGPMITAPENAIKGFAKSNGIEVSDLIQKENYFYFIANESGQSTHALLPAIVKETFSNLQGFKTMRWGNHTPHFLRPVYWCVMLYGNNNIDAEILGVKTSSYTFGHRFMSAKKILLEYPEEYENILFEEGSVLVDFNKRKEKIKTEITKAALACSGKVVLDESLLDEVTGLVEFPVIYRCQFSKDFLSVPKEAIITSIQYHQKAFPVVDDNDELLPYFIIVSNIESIEPEKVIAGNERVTQARLSDAMFFYEQDRKMRLGDYVKALQNVVFQHKLGSVADKVTRIVTLSEKIAQIIHADKESARDAAILCKADLMTQMVNEFPELQGIMGYYYSKAEGQSENVALGIREHYLPRFAKDMLPKTPVGCVVALADRWDTLNSIIQCQGLPTGEKDPFGLRRAALGIIRIVTEKALSSIRLSEFSHEIVHQFILDRLPGYYQDNDFTLDTLQAVLEVERDNLYDIYLRMSALKTFRELPEALALSEANKRVKNILRKNEFDLPSEKIKIQTNLFESDAEKNLFQKIQELNAQIESKNIKNNYEVLLKHLADFKTPIDDFFNEVMVESENAEIKQNRLGLLKMLRDLFLKVADISLLQ